MIWILAIILGVHLSYYLFLFLRLASHKDQPDIRNDQADFSLVICCKNEAENVDSLMENILSQDIPEIILVDDHSTDQTHQKLLKYQNNKIRVHAVSRDVVGKKIAANEGLDLARFDRILVTDADCKPATLNWARLMNNCDKPIVLGYSPMSPSAGIINLFSRYETYMTGIQYLSYAKAGIPYMGVGRNMLLDRTLKQSNQDKIKGQHLASGDDDLTINSIANQDNVAICIDPDSFVHTQSKTSLRAFIRQKTRHVSTATYYKPIHQVLLAGFSGSQILFYLILIIGTCLGTISAEIAIIALMVKWVVTQMINWPMMGRLKERNLFWKFPLLDILLCIYYLLLPIIILTSKKDNHWN